MQPYTCVCVCLQTAHMVTHPSLVLQVLLILGLRCLSGCELLITSTKSSDLRLSQVLLCVCVQ